MRNRLTERDLSRIVKRVINEQNEDTLKQFVIDMIRRDIDYFEKKTDMSGEELVNILKEKLGVNVAEFLRKQEMVRYRTPVVTKVYIEKYGNPGSGRCLQNPKLNNSCDSGKSFVEFNDGTILKYPNISYSSYVDSGTYEGDEIKSLTSPYIVSFKLNNKQYEINKNTN